MSFNTTIHSPGQVYTIPLVQLSSVLAFYDAKNLNSGVELAAYDLGRLTKVCKSTLDDSKALELNWPLHWIRIVFVKWKKGDVREKYIGYYCFLCAMLSLR